MREVQQKRAVWKIVCLSLLLALRCLLGCPIYRWFGFPCPGCGLTRAWLYFLAGDWYSAFEQHPLFLPAQIFIFLFAKRDALPKKLRMPVDVMLHLFVISAIACYVFPV